MAAFSFDWSGYLNLAEELGQRADEGSLRSAISRAYYYVYHLALHRAEANGFKPKPDEGTHAQLWRLFSRSPEPDCHKLAIIANRLREKRNRADYENIFLRVAEEVPLLLEDAKKFTMLLGTVHARHPDQKSMRQ